jgi:hypothetical protein
MSLSLSVKAALLLGCALAYGQDRAPMELVKRVTGRQLQVTARNVSGQPLVAYVVLIQSMDGTHTTTAHGIYAGGDSMGPGGSERLGPVALEDKSEQDYRVVLDYVRLADGTEFGSRTTEQSKRAAARFQK